VVNWKVLIVAFVVCLLSFPSVAQRTETIAGLGTAGCGEYLADRQVGAHSDGVYASWILGYISAYNLYSTSRPVAANAIPKTSTALAYLDKYCRDNPLSLVVAGAGCLIGDLGGERLPRCKAK
jgi:hypothetical protein